MIGKKKNIPKPTHFGKNLRFLRRLEGLTQSAFAEIIGITRNSIASYENGMVEPSAHNFLRVCEYFNVDEKSMLEDILSNQDDDSAKSKDVLVKYAEDSFQEFLKQTNEMTKVYEGYKVFYAMQKDKLTDDENRDFYLILDDLMTLLQSLIAENWRLIKNVYPQQQVLDDDE
ncbi:helix-turn-helix domain-containing protein [Portibacter lacus]|uniref:HTH cro/C1-type domain-containing protein n=1 Tax=Portibacter lacus TaxID=1099794 RepID=A0AA37SLA6_9BACT|nr:helix-turn-helix domain-containing protein [Portibacter lacus]GLR15724.1 hypothetical protein GCM10007940_03390 [Portibacter lacus]